jgi:DNA-binding MarR family transcriptional regulator
MDEIEKLEPDDLASMISYQIRLIQIAAYKSFESKARGFGSAPRYYGLLRIVESNPGLNQSRLAKAVFLDRSSLVPILEALTKEGIIERSGSKTDKRIRRVFITEKGRALLEELRVLVDEHESDLAEPLSEAERGMLSELLQKISDHQRSGDTSSSSLGWVA